MIQNPSVIFYDAGYSIRFVRKNWKVLVWVQDLFSKKMKSANVDRPVIIFSNKKEAEKEIKQVVIPYLLTEKQVESNDIVGWE